jgi:ectoine hydroxylase-related dioxygenase (phytanoyl-CoA dioxygenase family)
VQNNAAMGDNGNLDDTASELAATVAELREVGYTVVPDVIPASELASIRDEVVAAQRRHHDDAEAELARIRARGHRVGAKGVRLLKQVINVTQCFAPYLAAPRIMGTATALFGDFVRISCTDCVINLPGNERGYWHADWPYNATNSTHVQAPYASQPDAIMHLSSIWMLTEFTAANGGTFFVPGSHGKRDNPAGETLTGLDRDAPHPQERQALGSAGSVLLYDSRMWHAVAPNLSDEPRVALIVRYAPWWLNLTPSLEGTPDHQRMVLATGGKSYDAALVQREVYDKLPEPVKPLYHHMVADQAEPKT